MTESRGDEKEVEEHCPCGRDLNGSNWMGTTGGSPFAKLSPSLAPAELDVPQLCLK